MGRYGAGTTRSRIPLGPFYGHSYILPWEWREYADSHNYTTPSSASNSSAQSSPVKQLEVVSQSALLQHLGVFLSLQEDLQCRYSLACNRLSSLLSSVADAQFVSSHVKYYLKRGQRKSEEDSSILQSYNECLQLQLQLNLAQRAIGRLQRALGQYWRTCYGWLFHCVINCPCDGLYLLLQWCLLCLIYFHNHIVSVHVLHWYMNQ